MRGGGRIATALVIVSSILLLVGVLFTVGYRNSVILREIGLSHGLGDVFGVGYAINNAEDLDSDVERFLFLGIMLSFIFSFVVNLFLLIFLKRKLHELSNAERRITRDVRDLADKKDDEIREVVVTRGILASQLASTQRSIEGIKKKR